MNEKKAKDTTEPVYIKKYANRRLYNMETSSYVTLEDLAELVKKDVKFIVKDAKTEADLTRQVLVQIILEQEAGGAEMLPVEMLRSLIRYYNTDMHQSFSNYLTGSMQSFTTNQEELLKNFSSFGKWDSIQDQQTEWFKKTMEMMNPLKSSSS
ncbi:MAG: polyhydroxyalkanoate synthesis repressor PhaR [Rickettsiales bacterium]|nr:polyhydroxyalkanoate synthesis repressor PhaR [Rickettsiales bacterium]